MNEEQIDRVLDSLETIGGQAAELGGQAFEVMIRQQMLFGYALVAGGLLVFLAYLGAVFFTWRRAVHLEWERGEKGFSRYGSDYEALAWTAGFGSIFGIGGIIAISSGVLRLLNPTYYVIQELLRAL